MPFITNRFRCGPSFGHIYLPELVTRDDDSGNITQEIALVDQSKDLPPLELFDLGKQLKEGVNLKQVSGIMVQADTFPVDSLLDDGKTSKDSGNGIVKDDAKPNNNSVDDKGGDQQTN